MISQLMIFFTTIVWGFDTIGWYLTNNQCNEAMTPDTFPFNYYTHIVVESTPIVAEDGSASCNQTDPFLKRMVELGKIYGKKIIWRDGLPTNNFKNVFMNKSWIQYRAKYLATIDDAMTMCRVDGIEFDYEPIDGTVTKYEATQYTEFLASIKSMVGPIRTVGIDMGIWGITRGSFPLMIEPWIDVEMLKENAFDYVNIMSYHSNDNLFNHTDDTILPWIKDTYILTQLWNMPADKINLGIPYYSFNKTYNEVSWCQISNLCPNIDLNATECTGIRIVSKKMNFEIGQYIKSINYRGAFLWPANYDSIYHNNTMVEWLHQGLYY